MFSIVSLRCYGKTYWLGPGTSARVTQLGVGVPGFNADKSVNTNEDLSRGFRCHMSEAEIDYVFTIDEMRKAD